MKLLEYDSTNRGHISYYKAVPLSKRIRFDALTRIPKVGTFAYLF